jgi:hypothetical protein
MADMAFNAAINSHHQMMQQQQMMNSLNNQRQMQQAMYTQQGGYGHSGPGFQHNIADAQVGGGSIGWRGGVFGNFGYQPNEGYALDQNRNGRYDRGRDAVLVFDTNRDGKYDKKDVQNTNNMMQSVTGNFDFNNDGRISMSERIQGAAHRRRYAQLDTNRDGRLEAHEIAQGGGKVWVDRSRGGGVGRNELHSVYNMPNSNGYGPSQRLDFVDPFQRTSHTSNNWGWNPQPNPWGGGYPGCGCGGGYGGNYGGGYGGNYGGGYGY